MRGSVVMEWPLAASRIASWKDRYGERSGRSLDARLVCRGDSNRLVIVVYVPRGDGGTAAELAQRFLASFGPERQSDEDRPGLLFGATLLVVLSIARGVRTGNGWSRCLCCAVFCTNGSLLDDDSCGMNAGSRRARGGPQEAYAASSSHGPTEILPVHAACRGRQERRPHRLAAACGHVRASRQSVNLQVVLTLPANGTSRSAHAEAAPNEPAQSLQALQLSRERMLSRAVTSLRNRANCLRIFVTAHSARPCDSGLCRLP